MGIVDELLVEFDLAGVGHCRVEADVNGTVHLHLGNVRLELSRREFDHFVATLETAQSRLHESKALDGAEAPRDAEERAVDAV